MLGNYPVAATIPVTDISRSKAFYTEKLGLKLVAEADAGITLEAGKGTQLFLYQRGPSKADHTLAAFDVDNLEEVVKELISNGVVFEHYAEGPFKTNELGIADLGSERAAWLKDPDGNIIGVGQMSK